MKASPIRSGLVMLFAIALTTLGIQASDTLQGVESSLLGQLIGTEKTCPADMVEVTPGLTFRCVDRFEAGPSPDCPFASPVSKSDTTVNLNDPDCISQGTNSEPWRFVTRESAIAICSKSGKRLPTAGEWYQSALGTPPERCNLFNTEITKEGYGDCISTVGAVHMVGNLWEWVSDDIIEGEYDGRTVPASGNIANVDNDGVPTETLGIGATGTEQLPGYFWSEKIGAYGLIRGGFYGSGADGGIYTTHAGTKASFSGSAIGFRCVK